VRRRRLIAALAGLAASSAAAGCLGGDLPSRALWHTPVGPDNPTDIAIADGVVAVSKAFETFGVESNGTVTWKRFDYGGPVCPLVDGFLAIGAPNYGPRNAENVAILHRLAADGPIRWERPIGPLDGFVGADADQTRAYILRSSAGRANEEGGDLLVARALSDGAEQWRAALAGPALGPRMVGGRSGGADPCHDPVLVTVGPDVVGRDPVTGVERWRVPSVDSRWPPAVCRGHAYVTREEPPAVQVVGGDGREVGRYALPGDRARGPLAVVGGTGLIGTTRGNWGVDPTTGDRRWRWPGTPARYRSDPRETATVVDGRVVVVDGHGGVLAVDDRGRRAWRVGVPDGANVVAGDEDRGVVYAAGERGLYALRG
jgi:hypothetical protein